MDTRRDFIRKAALLSGSAAFHNSVPASIRRAMAINPNAGTTWKDAEHVVFLMQENRSFDHCYGSLQGVRGFNDPRAISFGDGSPVWLQRNPAGNTYAPFRLDIRNTKATWMNALPHSWEDQVDARNNGLYDQWLQVKAPGQEAFQHIPLTLGYYSRADIPFYYALADAFTVCDQHFCSSLTGTTPNRLFFWTGTIREDENAYARVRNGDTDYDKNAHWTTYPERLEAHSITWRIYQNELSVGAGLSPEEDSWLGNFTDNPLEWFSQYQVKLSAGYLDYLDAAPALLQAGIGETELKLASAGPEEKDAIGKILRRKKQQLSRVEADRKTYTRERYNELPVTERSIHDRAFTTNRGDRYFHELTSLTYTDGGIERTLKVPKGDILHQFREDVSNNQLPTVSWLVAPESFSDHPTSPWYGAWYVSEVLDILTQNPEIWKKTIFILTYDENDGYFDHVPPFVPPHPEKKESGKTTGGIRCRQDYSFLQQEAAQHPADHCRESPVGLGYRVPMVIASPWSRGGWVNSEVFDHTSSLQFLEQFMKVKFGKDIRETNISSWRRAVCGDLRSVFRPYNGEEIKLPSFLEKNAFISSIHAARNKDLPVGFRAFNPGEIEAVIKDPVQSGLLPVQEPGIRFSNAIPYELYANGYLDKTSHQFILGLSAGNQVFGKDAAGSPFIVYEKGVLRTENTPGNKIDPWPCRYYAVEAGAQLSDHWNLSHFQEGCYQLELYGPNGFYRSFRGSSADPDLELKLKYESLSGSRNRLSGNLVLYYRVQQEGGLAELQIKDNSYGKESRIIRIGRERKSGSIILETTDSHNWYDLSVIVPGYRQFEQRFAGRVETGMPSRTDPLMGRLV